MTAFIPKNPNHLRPEDFQLWLDSQPEFEALCASHKDVNLAAAVASLLILIEADEASRFPARPFSLRRKQ